MARRPPTEAQKAERAEQLEHLHAQIADKAADLTSSEQWQAWLRVASRFHQYSFNNTILIWTQRPDATLVAGYTTWQKSFHRQVTRGEHGIRILAPVTRRLPKTKPDGTPLLDDKGKPLMATQIVGVKPTSVFDISQTTGDPVPEPPQPVLLTGQAPDGLWHALATLVGEQGFRLERGDCHGANGYTDYTTRTVKIRDDVDDAQAVKTLAHELGHVLLHQPTTDATPVCRGSREVEAESVAYLVTAAHGLDSSQYTFTYVAGWAEQALPHHPDGTTVADVIHTTGTRVLKAAHQILDATAAPDNTQPVAQALTETVTRNVAADRTALLTERAGSPVSFKAAATSRPAHQVEVSRSSLRRGSSPAAPPR
ncbi:ArdC-like ssDNA-binding domain-containing protein [Luteococcus sediminum]